MIRIADWLEQIEAARREGIGIDRGNYVRGYLILSAPVFQDGKMVQALSVVSANGQISSDRLESLKSELQASATRLSH